MAAARAHAPQMSDTDDTRKVLAKGDGYEVVAAQQKATIPVLPGWRHEFGVGPYPPDAPESHRLAFYAKLIPEHPAAIEACRYKNASYILGTVPLLPGVGDEIRREPNGALAEDVARTALLPAWKEAIAINREVGIK